MQATPGMEPWDDKTGDDVCHSIYDSCALLRVPIESAAALIGGQAETKGARNTLNICFLCGSRSYSQLRNIENPEYSTRVDDLDDYSIVSVIKLCWNIVIQPAVPDGRRIRSCLKCIKAIKRSLTIKKKLEEHVRIVEERLFHNHYATEDLFSDISSLPVKIKPEVPEDDADYIFSKNFLGTVSHDVKFEHGYAGTALEESLSKTRTRIFPTADQTRKVAEDDTKKNVAKNASAKSTPAQQIRSMIASSVPTSLMATEQATESPTNSEHMYSMGTSLADQANSLFNGSTDLFKRLYTPRRMDSEERNQLLKILNVNNVNENLVAQTIFDTKFLMESVRACIVKDVNAMTNKLTSITCEPGPSVLRRMSTDDIFRHEDLMLRTLLELRNAMPIVFDILMTLCNPIHIKRTHTLSTVAMIYAMAMYNQNKDLCAMQRLNTLIVTRYNPGCQLLKILNRFRITFSDTSTINRVIHKQDVQDMEEAIADADEKARQDVEGNSETDQRQDGDTRKDVKGTSETHQRQDGDTRKDVKGTLETDQGQDAGEMSQNSKTKSSKRRKKKVVDDEFSFLLDAAQSCAKYLFQDKLAKNRQKERNRQIRRLRKAQKKTRHGIKMGDSPFGHSRTKPLLKKKRTIPVSNTSVCGKKRRRVVLKIQKAAQGKKQIEALQNANQADLVGQVIDTDGGNGQHTVTEYTIVHNTDVPMQAQADQQTLCTIPDFPANTFRT